MSEAESEPKRRRVDEEAEGDGVGSEGGAAAAAAGGSGGGAAAAAGGEGEGSGPTPQLELMPPTPGVPPIAPQDPKELSVSDQERLKNGIALPDRDFGSADTKLWTKVQADIFRSKKVLKNMRWASGYMRWWFKQHEGMPNQPPKAPISAYALWFTREKSQHAAEGGKWNNKKDGKRLGIKWKTLQTEEDPVVAAVTAEHAVLKAQYQANEDMFYNLLEAWQGKRHAALTATGQPLDNYVRVEQGLEVLCDCPNCPELA
eukprot:gene9737-6201_t